ncbi:MAG: tetratricopeptide repeat protein [Acidobacteria bacterium]|nr:tetratricopeptide repeat protein [Acidobacteriota bacterium]MCW5970751.1 tetratricopeptide repeat protein [Blastocatellales bacterium]
MNVRLGYVGAEPAMPPPPPLEKFLLESSTADTQRPPILTRDVDPGSVLQAYHTAQALLASGDWEGAENAFKQLIRIWPTAPAYLLLGFVLFVRKEYVRARQYFGKAMKLAPKDVPPHIFLAITDLRMEKPERAVSEVLKALKIDPENPDAYFLLGYIHANLRQWREAEKAYRKAVRLRTNFAEAYQYLALLYFELGSEQAGERRQRFRQAIETYRELIVACPDAISVYLNIGYLSDQLGETEEAAEAYQQAVEAAPDDLIDLAEIGTYLLNVRQFCRASAIFQRALGKLEEAPESKDVTRAQICTGLGIAALGVYGTRDADDSDARILEEAEKYFLDALADDPDYIHAQLNLGSTYYEQGRLDDAINAVQKALDLDPANASAQRNLNVLMEEKLKQRLLEAGLLKEIKRPIRDFAPYPKRTPITVRGTPLSETIVEDRR